MADHIKGLVVAQRLRPGDRLPNEADLITRLDKSKGTIREAMRILEAEGLIRTRTGPGGGAFLTEMTSDLATTLLANFFYFRDLSIDDLYQLRIVLEPELAASVAGKIAPDVLAGFRANTHRYAHPPRPPRKSAPSMSSHWIFTANWPRKARTCSWVSWSNSSPRCLAI